MPFQPEQSAIRVDKELEKALQNASFEEMKEILHSASTRQGLTVPDKFSPDVLIPTELADAAPKRFGKAITVDGQKRFFEADSELELEREIGDYFRETLNARDTNPARQQQQQSTEQPRNERGQFTAAESTSVDAAQKAELLLKFQLNQISAAEYLEQSGEISDYLARQGVPLDAVREVVAEKKDHAFAQSWSDAVAEFLQSPAGRSWPGGEQNLARIQSVLWENNLVDTEDKVQALAAAFEHMKANDMLDTSAADARKAISEATSFEAVKAAASSLFGR
jgi:hypothetical protein